MRTMLVLTAAFIAFRSEAAEQRIPLPDLIGLYELSTFNDQSTDPPNKRTASVQTGIPILDYRGLRIEFAGSIFSGAAVGDGVVRQPVAVPLRGSFAPSVMVGNWGLRWLFVAEEVDGPLEKIFDFPGAFELPFLPSIDYFDPSITLSLSPSTYSFTDINYVDGPAWPIVLPDVRGINITTPMRGEITSAFLVVQYVPEPASFVLFCLGVAALVFIPARRKPHGR
jgi:hypothetical protein